MKNENLLNFPIAIISARGNSKRFKNKNIYPLYGKPMIYWVIMAAKNSKLIKDIYVTSDDPRILKISKFYGVKIINRKKKLAKPDVPKIEAVRDAIKIIIKKNYPSLVVSLQANSPEIKAKHIDKSINHLIKFNRNEVVSVDKNFNQDAAIRVIKTNYLFKKSLSSHLGFVITNLTDIHYKNDLKKIKKNVFK